MPEKQDLKSVFKSFAPAGAVDIDSRTFVKVCKDGGLLDSKFTTTDADLIFAKVKAKGSRKITFDQFQEAVKQIALRKDVDFGVIEDKLRSLSGPKFVGTVAEHNRLHDDKSTYTGVHQYGGPSTVDKGRTAISDLSEITDRSSYNIRGVKTSLVEKIDMDNTSQRKKSPRK